MTPARTPRPAAAVGPGHGRGAVATEERPAPVVRRPAAKTAGHGRPPLLITGLPRSGTSWVGKMLEASGEVVYVNEPLNPEHPPGHSPGVLNATVRHRFQYICDENATRWLLPYGDTIGLRYRFGAELRRNRGPYDLARLAKYGTSFTLGRLRGRRAMLDDPFALLSTRWFAQRLGCRVIVLVRDPVALVGSWRKLDWQVHFHELLEQPLLVRDLLSPETVAELRALIGSPDQVRRTATLWRVAYDIVHRHFADLPGVHVQSYEALARDPERGFAKLYDFCDLAWSPRVVSAVRQATRSMGPKAARGVSHPAGREAHQAAGRSVIRSAGQEAAGLGATTRSGDPDRGSHRWSMRFGLSKTAFRPMDSAASLESYRQRLTEHEIARVRILTDEVLQRLRVGQEL